MNLLQKLTLNNVLKIVAIIAIIAITISISIAYYFVVIKPKIANEKLAFDKEQQIALKKDAEMKIKLENDKTAKEILLTKSKECQSYQTEIENRLKDNNIDGQTFGLINELDIIFYSPKLNSCLYTYETLATNTPGNSFNIVGQDYHLVNIFTNEAILTIKTKGQGDALYESQKSLFDSSVNSYK